MNLSGTLRTVLIEARREAASELFFFIKLKKLKTNLKLSFLKKLFIVHFFIAIVKGF